MPQNLEIIISPTAVWSLQEIESYKIRYIGAPQAAIFVDDMLSTTVSAVTQNPSLYRFNVELSDMGVQVREKLLHDGQYRALYTFDGQSIEVLLIISTKMDLINACYRYSMLPSS